MRRNNRYVTDKRSKPSSVFALITVNLFPIFGVLFWEWEIFPIMLLFWSENVVIGFFNILNMLLCQPEEKPSWVMKAILIPFFAVHYGGFTAGHGLFVTILFGQDLFKNATGPRLELIWEMVKNYNLFLAILALFLSHGYSFVTNYLVKGEYRHYELHQLMTRPYGRVVLLHLTLIIGGFLMAMLQSPVFGLILFIFLKIVMDLFSHLKEHRVIKKKST